uniref:Putative GTP-binding protein YjiA n=1 Tax=Rhizophora mucronata TaxID=61149 RepID=A0A2P2MHG8_RHIMU
MIGAGFAKPAEVKPGVPSNSYREVCLMHGTSFIYRRETKLHKTIILY